MVEGIRCKADVKVPGFRVERLGFGLGV